MHVHVSVSIYIVHVRVQGTLDTENPIIITGTVDRGRFGSAIVNIGDINNDGVEGGVTSAMTIVIHVLYT